MIKKKINIKKHLIMSADGDQLSIKKINYVESIKPVSMFISIIVASFLIELGIMGVVEPYLIDSLGGFPFAFVDAFILALFISLFVYRYQMLPMKQAVAQVFKNKESLIMAAQIYECGSESVFVTDSNLNQVFNNSAFELLFSMNRKQSSGISLALLLVDRSKIAMLKSVLADEGKWHGTLQMLSASGESFPADVRVSRIPMYERSEDRFVITINDISSDVQAKADIEFLTKYEPATLLPNELMLHQFIEQRILSYCSDCAKPGECTPCPNKADRGFILAIFRVRGLANVNDVYGRVACNTMISELANDLIKFTSEKSVARISNDEFAVLVDRHYDDDDAKYILNKLCEIIAEERIVLGNKVLLRMDCGYSSFPENTVIAAEVINNSALALHSASIDSTSHLYKYTIEMQEKIHTDELMRSELMVAVNSMDFEIVYQPQTRIEDGHLVGVEALLRWTMSDGTPVSPERFVPELERMGVIYEVGLWVLDQCCRQGRIWLDLGMPKFSMAVNVSALQLLNDGFARDVLGIITKTRFPPSCLELELTESCMVRDPEAAEELMRDLGSIGVQIAIDDFGTGYSSLAYLKRFTTLDKLKIDKSFIDSIEGDKENIITNAIISLAKSLNLKAIAEGVEDQHQADYLKRHGCDEIQGYLISKPLSAEQLTEYASCASLINNNVIKLAG